MSDPRNKATGDWLAAESMAFDRDYARSRHNDYGRECRCPADSPICRWCPERGAPMALVDAVDEQTTRITPMPDEEAA